MLLKEPLDMLDCKDVLVADVMGTTDVVFVVVASGTGWLGVRGDG